MTSEQPSRSIAGPIISLVLIMGGLVLIAIMGVSQLLSSDEGVPAAPIDLSIQFQEVAEGLDDPVLVTGAGDGSGDLYVVEQRGRILRLAQDGSVDGEPLLDIVDRVLHHHERGLLGAAFHPDWDVNGRLFVVYSRRGDGATTVSEFTLPRESPEPPDGQETEVRERAEATERALLTVPQVYTTHKGGTVAFDHEGMLLVSIGDGGSAYDPDGHGLDGWSLMGKLLRFDVDGGWPYAIPADNGFAGAPDARGELHAMGLRNPWRFSVDRATGDIYIGDVGQGAWEEVNVLRPGQDEVSFGWSHMEGPDCLADRPCDREQHDLPVVVYPHRDAGLGHCGVIGGHAYRGDQASLPEGTYVYGDYCSGVIWGVPARQLHEGNAAPSIVGHLDAELGQLRSFGEDDAGEIFAVTSGGHVLRVSEARGQAP